VRELQLPPHPGQLVGQMVPSFLFLVAVDGLHGGLEFAGGRLTAEIGVEHGDG